MDTESFEQIAIAETAVAEALRWTKPSSEVDVLFIDDEPADLQLPSAVDLEVTPDRPGAARRHGLGRRHQAGDARDGRGHPGAAVRRAGERIRVDTRSRRLRRARRGGPDDASLGDAPASSGARGGRALPARPHGPAAGGDARGGRIAVRRARWRTRRPTARRSSTRSSTATRTAGRCSGSSRWSAASCGSR